MTRKRTKKDRKSRKNNVPIREQAARDIATELPVLHRLAIVYLMLPVFIYLLGWFHYWFSIPAAALLVAGLWKAMAGSWRVTVRPVTIALLLLALGWVMLTASGGVFDLDNGDWKLHRTMLSDLARHAWPVYLSDPFAPYLPPEAEQPDALLRYYLGWYMTPGLIGHWFGPAALNWAVMMWDVVRCCLDVAVVHADVHDNAGGDRCRGNSRILQWPGLFAYGSARRLGLAERQHHLQ